MPKPAPIETRGPPIKLIYEPVGGADMDALAFADYLKESISALKQTASLLADRTVSVRYVVQSLEKKSPEQVVLAPIIALTDRDLIHRVQVTHVETIDLLQRGVIPNYLDYPARLTYQRLGKLSEKANFSTQVIANGASTRSQAALKDSLDIELGLEHTSTGTVRGYIRTYQSAGGRRLIRIEPRVGKPILGHFRERDRAWVRSMIDVGYVEAHGRMRYRSGEHQPYYIDVEAFRKVDTIDAPSFRDIDGLAPSLTGDQSTDDFAAEARDAW